MGCPRQRERNIIIRITTGRETTTAQEITTDHDETTMGRDEITMRDEITTSDEIQTTATMMIRHGMDVPRAGRFRGKLRTVQRPGWWRVEY